MGELHPLYDQGLSFKGMAGIPINITGQILGYFILLVCDKIPAHFCVFDWLTWQHP